MVHVGIWNEIKFGITANPRQRTSYICPDYDRTDMMLVERPDVDLVEWMVKVMTTHIRTRGTEYVQNRPRIMIKTARAAFIMAEANDLLPFYDVCDLPKKHLDRLDFPMPFYDSYGLAEARSWVLRMLKKSQAYVMTA